MSTQIIRRFTSYLAVPAVSAGILGAAAIGLAGLANADTTPSNTKANLASVSQCCKADLASVSDPTATKANLASVKPTGKKANLASVSDPAGKKANLASVSDPAGKKAKKA
ncbi:hypothetical protein M1247_33745 [Mycobacterium sp. 21AC1]|uniref:hypothetical protein n=1 Tax=[Mycobacterium] appelbergii TaxID=2939269 RepID=UPI0029395012|nr:hypothetical protein [Mycobacterium sp. 21AC1]MDV3129908.1 hypothetical protein [Mycobacterium sp. 21AC1]